MNKEMIMQWQKQAAFNRAKIIKISNYVFNIIKTNLKAIVKKVIK
jgi:hypothetical protein